MSFSSRTFRNILLACVVAVVSMNAYAQEAVPLASKANEQDIAAWRAPRFGMFIHWGPVSLKGTEIGWSRGREIPIEEYDQLYTKFNPTGFDANEWVQLAKDTGMKYLIITSKHHDGFSLWPSKYTDYDIGNTPFGRDVLKELSEACRKQDIAFGTYYSVCDWYHPYYPKGSPGGKTDKPNPNLDRYVEFLRNQVTELIQNYGPLSTMWFDVPREIGPEHGIPTVEMVRKLQPNIVINSRAYFADMSKQKGASRQDIVGDYSTPEQHVGAFSRSRPWETCMTLCKQWAWKPNDNMKSVEQCVQALLYTVGGDGNLLFNVGPMPDGRIEARQIERLHEMGQWVKKHGDGIYGTRGGPFKPDKEWGASTCKDNNIYLYVMKWPETGALQLPAIDMKVTGADALAGGKLRFKQTKAGISIGMPEEHRQQIATVIKLTVKGKAFDIEPVDVVAKEAKAK